MGTFPSITPKNLCKILVQKGFVLKHIKGSHHYYQHSVSGKTTVVPMHKKDLPKGTLYAILKQAGIDKSEI